MSGDPRPDPSSVTRRASGKVILLGEHAVVHGARALAVGIARGVVVEATRSAGELELRVPGSSTRFAAGDGSQEGAALEALVSRIGSPRSGVSLTATFEIPTRAGLGSSAALAGAAARALAALGGVDLDDGALFEVVQASERVFHGNPSGLDAATALHGGIVLFSRSEGPRAIPVSPPPPLAVFHSGEDGDTRATVAAFSERLAATGEEGATRLARIGELTDAGLAALEEGRLRDLGAAMDENHEILSWFGVSTPPLDRLVSLAREAGALGAKLTGGGGGGCVVALVEPGDEAVTRRITGAGFRAVST